MPARYRVLAPHLVYTFFLSIFVGGVALADSNLNTINIPITARVTCYAPGAGGSIEGPFETSRPGKDGQAVPRTLDDFRLGRSQYVTLASNPSNYGKYYNMGTISYVSNLDSRQYTISNVVGYVHDTGSAFRGSGCARYNTCGVMNRKFDIAYGDYRKGGNVGLVNSSALCANRDTQWTQIGGPLNTPPDVVAGNYVDTPNLNSNLSSVFSNTPKDVGFPSNTNIPNNANTPYPSALSSQPGGIQPLNSFSPANPSQLPTVSSNAYSSPLTSGTLAPLPPSVADQLLALLQNPTTSKPVLSGSTTPTVYFSPNDEFTFGEPEKSLAYEPDTATSGVVIAGVPTASETFISPDMGISQVIVQTQTQNIFLSILDALKSSLLRILQALSFQ